MASQDRVLVKDGRRHHRPVYSRTEFRLGMVLLAGLAGLVSWVVWRGAHPDPELFSMEENLAEPGGSVTVLESRPAPSLTGAAAPSAPAATADRGPLPEGLAGDGWTEGPVSTFGVDDLYVKIDGREGYYKSFGFRQLWFVSLSRADDPATVVDVEVYDLGEVGNALGAYAGERPQGGKPDIVADGLSHLDRNALCVTRGHFYIRAIGSDEGPVVRKELEKLRGVLEDGIEGAALPLTFGLFVGQLGMGPDQVSYVAENAFSFGFASDVYVARLEDDTELFVVRKETEEDAKALANRFHEGFLGYGSAIDPSLGVSWTEDRYIRTVAGAKHVGRWTIGVRGAPDRGAAEDGVRKLDDAVRRFPETAEE
jgi:Family of unknown function (DUF6599)